MAFRPHRTHSSAWLSDGRGSRLLRRPGVVRGRPLVRRETQIPPRSGPNAVASWLCSGSARSTVAGSSRPRRGGRCWSARLGPGRGPGAPANSRAPVACWWARLTVASTATVHSTHCDGVGPSTDGAGLRGTGEREARRTRSWRVRSTAPSFGGGTAPAAHLGGEQVANLTTVLWMAGTSGALPGQSAAYVQQAGVVGGAQHFGAAVQDAAHLVGEHGGGGAGALDGGDAAETAAGVGGREIDQVEVLHRPQQAFRVVTQPQSPQGVAGGVVGATLRGWWAPTSVTPSTSVRNSVNS